MQDWIQQELDAVELYDKELVNQNRIPFWKAPVGITAFEVDMTHPVFNSKFEGKKVFHIFVEGDKYLWTVPVKSKTFSVAIRSLAKGIAKFRLMRMGTSVKDTRYELIPQ